MNKVVRAILDCFIMFSVTFFAINVTWLLYKAIFQRTIKPTNNLEYSATSVMITKLDGRSGGTGVIIGSVKLGSTVLTNAHVCSLLHDGGIVRSDSKKGLVKSFQISQIHDLCLVSTNANFKINTVVASDEPSIYDDAVISGHPHLLPNIVTHGHFSQREIVNILVGFMPCYEDDYKNDNAEYCTHFGKIPLIRSLEAQIVSATIMPGSSGSGVFNSKGEIAGLVFAGSGDFGYAMVVPQEYIASFLENELPKLRLDYPGKGISIESADDSPKWKSVCLSPPSKKIQKVCQLMSKSLLLTH